jgi:hypothetical protein
MVSWILETWRAWRKATQENQALPTDLDSSVKERVLQK